MSPQRAIEPSLQVPMDAYAFAAVSAPPPIGKPSVVLGLGRARAVVLIGWSLAGHTASDENAQGRRALGRVRFFAACARGAVCYLSVSVSPLALGAAPGCCEQQQLSATLATRTWSAALRLRFALRQSQPASAGGMRRRHVICACTGQSLATGDAERASLRCSCI